MKQFFLLISFLLFPIFRFGDRLSICGILKLFFSFGLGRLVCVFVAICTGL